MLEAIVRRNLGKWQGFYDHCPSSARNLLTSARGLLLSRIRDAGETYALLHGLRSHEWWSGEDIEALQFDLLRRAIVHATGTVSFYAEYPRARVQSLADLRKFPVLTRDQVRSNADRLISRSILPSKRIPAATTGTTGANLKVAYTEEVARANWAFTLRQWAWAGVMPRHPRVTLFGARVVPTGRAFPPYWTYNVPDRQVLVSIFHLSERTAPDYVAFLCSQQGKILEGFPSVLGILADFALRLGEQIPMRAVFTTGETLYPEVRAKIERVFGARVFDQYGMTEYCGLILECEHGGMHLMPEYGYLEILDDLDKPVAAGEEGHFVWTGFLNRAMPLIRYRIGDRGRWEVNQKCECGRAFPLVVPTITRESDILRLPDGRIFSPRALNQLLKESVSLRCCQFVHGYPGRVVARVVAGNGDAASEAARICKRLLDLLGPSTVIDFEFAAEPIVRAGGKIPLIIQRADTN